MGIDFVGMLRQADEYVRRNLKSKAVRAAEKRRAERKSREAEARIVRAAWVGGASGATIFGVCALIAPVAVPVLAAAGGGALLLAVGSLFRPSRRRGGEGDFSRVELAELPGDAEDWLLDRREALPLDCRPQLDRIFRRLGDLQPHLASLAPHSTPAWEARRLLGDHLPRSFSPSTTSRRRSGRKIRRSAPACTPVWKPSPTRSTSSAAKSAATR